LRISFQSTDRPGQSSHLSFFPGRTDILIKNRFALLKRHAKSKFNTQSGTEARETFPQPASEAHKFSPQVETHAMDIPTSFDYILGSTTDILSDFDYEFFSQLF
jgi:hypothetical protein